MNNIAFSENTKSNIDSNYLKICKEFFYVWASRCETPVFYNTPPDFKRFEEYIETLDEDQTLKEFMAIIHRFKNESSNKNPLDVLFSQLTKWNINFHLVIKEFIPYVLMVAPHVKFKRAGCILQTNNHFYLFSDVLKNILVQSNWNININQEVLEDLLVVFIGMRYRQIHGEKDYNQYENKFFVAYNKAMEETNHPTVDNLKEAFSEFRKKMLLQRITNENLYNALKAFQNILGKKALNSTKKTTFYWQMYADLQCVDKQNYTNSFQEKFFLEIRTNEKQVFIHLNKDYFKAMKQLNMIERIGTHRVVYIYILYNFHKKLKENYQHKFSHKATPFVEALLSSEPIFSHFDPYIEEIKEYFKKKKSELTIIYPQMIDIFNDKFYINEVSILNNYVNFSLKEELGILDYLDRKALYKPYM